MVLRSLIEGTFAETPLLSALALFLLLNLPIGAAAWAAKAPQEDGYITAFSCTVLPTPLRVEVVAFDDSEPAMKLQRLLVARLSARKIEADRNASYRVSIDMHVVFERAKQRRPDLIELSRRERSPGKPSLHEDYETRAQVNVWSTRRDSLIGGRKPTVVGKNIEQLRIVLAVHDKRTGRCLWQGEAVRDLNGGDRWAEAMRVLPQLVDLIGKTATRERLIRE